MASGAMGAGILESDAVMAGAGDGADDQIDAGQGNEGSQDGGQGSDGGDSQSQDGGQQQTSAQSQQLAKLSLKDLVKTKSEALKAIDKRLPNFLRDAAMREERLLGKFPNGVQEAIQMLDALEEHGGLEGLAEKAEALQDYGRLEELYEKGNPEFIDRLAEASPEAFSKVMPAGLERWRQTDPEMYSHVLAKVMVNTLDSARVSDQLAQIYQSLEKPEQKEAVARIWQMIEGFRQTASKAPEPKTADPREKALNQREQELTQRQVEAAMAPVRTAGIQHIAKVIDREMTLSYQWSETDSDIQQAIRERVQEELVKLSKKTGFDKDVDKLKARGDGKTLQRRLEQFQEKHIPNILPRVAKLFAVKAKTAQRQGQQQQKQGQQQQQADRGWERVAQMPAPGSVDRAKTTADMILNNQAILKNGKKVQWA